MDIENKIALSAVIVAFISPFIAWYLTKISGEKVFRKLSGRRKAVLGVWEGTATQEFKGGETITANVSVVFTSVRNKIVGNLDYTIILDEKQVTDKFKVYGGFLYESFLRLNYEHIDEGVQQFGATIMELDATGKYLYGKFTGFGSRANKIIKADVLLSKKP